MKKALVILLSMCAAVAAFATGEREDESFSYMGIDRIDVDSVFLNVEVAGGDGMSVSMRSDLPEDSFFDPRNFTVKHEVNGSQLRVWVETQGIFQHGGGTLFFRVPGRTRVNVTSASGEIRISDSSGDQVFAKSASGGVLLTDINAPVHAECVSGSLEVRRLHGDAELSTISGRLRIVDAEGRFTATSVSGSIDGDQITLTQDSRFKTVSGDIRINLGNSLDELRYDLSTVSGGLTVGSVRASRGLQMGNGELTLRGETVSGSQVYR